MKAITHGTVPLFTQVVDGVALHQHVAGLEADVDTVLSSSMSISPDITTA